jgi:hypothetical protein
MRIVYVFDMDAPDMVGHPYLFRAPVALARFLCRFSRHLDYALTWWSDEEMREAAVLFTATPDTLI